MSDTHRDASIGDDGFHEIQLSGKQLVFLFMATTIVAVVIFLCGVQVGRNVKGSDRLASIEPSEPVSAAALTPAPASTPTQAAPSSGPPAAEPPAPAQDDELSYAKRLQQADPAAGDKIAPAADKHAESKPAESRAASPKPAEPKPAPVIAPPKPAPAVAAAPASSPVAASNGRPGSWIVQLSAIKDRKQAASVARELVAKGYPAFVLDPAPGAPVIYRVQVGGYPDRETADQAARKLEKDDHYKPYVRSR